MKPKVLVTLLFATCQVLIGQQTQAQPKNGDIIHDAEHYILLEEHAERWAEEDKRNAARLEELRKQNDGKPPNILYIRMALS
jgi:arylsulfatase